MKFLFDNLSFLKLLNNVFVLFRVPDTAPMKLKMKYSSSFKALIDKAPKLNAKLEIHDIDDLKYQDVRTEVSQKK